MSTITIKNNGLPFQRIVKQPSRRDDRPDVWRFEFGAEDSHGYAPVSLYLTLDECRDLSKAIYEATNELEG